MHFDSKEKCSQCRTDASSSFAAEACNLPAAPGAQLPSRLGRPGPAAAAAAAAAATAGLGRLPAVRHTGRADLHRCRPALHMDHDISTAVSTTSQGVLSVAVEIDGSHECSRHVSQADKHRQGS